MVRYDWVKSRASWRRDEIYSVTHSLAVSLKAGFLSNKLHRYILTAV